MFKIDLHTHSIASPDGSLTAADYERMLYSGGLDAIAVTDHDTIEFALQLNKKLGKKIIIGEEIKTNEGELIGLFLSKRVKPGLTPEETVVKIREQNGLVYIPHPFETFRSGIQDAVLERIVFDVDILEAYNGRGYLRGKSEQAVAWAEKHHVPIAASSDTHGRHGWGKTYSIIKTMPNRNNLAAQLAEANHSKKFVGLAGMLYPARNKLKKRLNNG